MTRSRKKENYALVVGEAPSASVIEEALAVGIEVRACPGPSVLPCPAATGATCPLRKHARVSVVYLTNSEDRYSTLPCFAVDGAPAVGVVEGSSLPLHAQEGYALVGARGGALGVLEAVAAVIEPDDVKAPVLRQVGAS